MGEEAGGHDGFLSVRGELLTLKWFSLQRNIVIPLATTFPSIRSGSPGLRAAGDQPDAIDKLIEGSATGSPTQTLLGVTGSGKTYTMANVIARLAGRPWYWRRTRRSPRSCMPSSANSFPTTPSSTSSPIMTTTSPRPTFRRRSVYRKGLLDQRAYRADAPLGDEVAAGARGHDHRRDGVVHIRHRRPRWTTTAWILHCGRRKDVRSATSSRAWWRCSTRGTSSISAAAPFRVRGDVLDVFPAENSETALRITLFDDEVESLTLFDPLTGRATTRCRASTVYPSSHYVTPRSTTLRAIEAIKLELAGRIEYFQKENKLVEAQRIEQRTRFDLEMLNEMGFCKGIENYSRHLSGRKPGEPPPTLIDYLPPRALMIIDESHVTIGQARRHVQRRPLAQGEPGQLRLRLPSALDNRPLKFEEFEGVMRQTIFVSATPAD